MKVIEKARRSMIGAGLAAVVLGTAIVPLSSYALDQSDPGANQRMARGADSDAAAKVKSALSSNPTFDGKHVNVAMDNGNVVLSGFVQSSQAVEDATRIATKAAGDHKVVNHLSIQQNYSNEP
jgi:osmotically-inducible protein OsmY